MIKVVPISEKVGKYCTHCDKPAVVGLLLCNPKVIQQSVTAYLCKKCLSRLKKELGTSPNSQSDAIALWKVRTWIRRNINTNLDEVEKIIDTMKSIA